MPRCTICLTGLERCFVVDGGTELFCSVACISEVYTTDEVVGYIAEGTIVWDNDIKEGEKSNVQ